jgi:PmbA protein
MNLIKFALKNGADDVAIEKNSGEMRQIRFANNSIQIFNVWNISIYDIFLSHKKRTVNTTVYGSSEKELTDAIKKLIKYAKIVKPNQDYFGIANGPFEYKKIPKLFDKKIVNANLSDMAESMINTALENSKNTAGIVYTDFYHRDIETSGNVSASEKSTFIKLSIRAFNKDEETGHAASCSRVLSSIDPEKIGRKAGEIAKMAKEPQKLEPDNFDVIFDPLSASNLLSTAGAMASAFFVDSGMSFLREKIGKKIANDNVTLIDDGTIPNGYQSTSFDGEGVPTKKTNIIENGILKTYLHNTSTAKKYKTKTTASAGIIAPYPRNIILKEGKLSKENLFENFSGLYITNVWYTRFQNYLTGDFSTIPRDGVFLFQNGEIVKSIKDIRVSDNLQRMLENISKISNKSEWIIWWGLDFQVPVLTPYILIKDVNITQSRM